MKNATEQDILETTRIIRDKRIATTILKIFEENQFITQQQFFALIREKTGFSAPYALRQAKNIDATVKATLDSMNWRKNCGRKIKTIK